MILLRLLFTRVNDTAPSETGVDEGTASEIGEHGRGNDQYAEDDPVVEPVKGKGL